MLGISLWQIFDEWISILTLGTILLIIGIYASLPKKKENK